MKTAIVTSLLLLAGPASAPTPIHAGQASPPQPVTWTLTLDPAVKERPAGGTLTAVVKATMEDGWHVYSDEELPGGPRPLRIEVVAKQPFRQAGKLVSPEPERDFDQAFAQVTSFFKTTASFRLPVAIDAGAAPGAAVLNLDVTFQACDGRMCLPGRVVKLSAPVTIARAPDRPKK